MHLNEVRDTLSNESFQKRNESFRRRYLTQLAKEDDLYVKTSKKATDVFENLEAHLRSPVKEEHRKGKGTSTLLIGRSRRIVSSRISRVSKKNRI
jgi:hypothetical protein